MLLIIFSLLKCIKRCCCGRSKSKIVPQPVMAPIPSNVPGQRIPSWTSLQNNGNNIGGDGRRDSSQPLMPPPMYNLVPPQRGGSPALNRGHMAGRPSDDIAPVRYSNPFEPTERERVPPHPAALRPGGPNRSSRGPATPEPSYPLPPAAPRQSAWGAPGVAGVGSAARPPGGTQGVTGPGRQRSNWVDDQMYNGPR